MDTNSLRAQGFNVEEVAGACFCCRFDDLVGKVGRLQAGERPDVILAEPVGSCTDLVATVVQPLRDLYGDRFEVAPYAVLFKPDQGLRILRNESGSGFSPKAAYIFRKQLEEADAIVLNRIDEMTPEAREGAGRIDGERISGNAGVADVGEDRRGVRGADGAARPAGRTSAGRSSTSTTTPTPRARPRWAG